MYWVGFDVGGTFVDIFAFDTETGTIHTMKRRSSRREAAAHVERGLADLLAEIGGKAEDVRRLAHGTTLVTNILVERAGAKVGVVTTKGFRDLLEIGRMRRPSLYDLSKDKPSPLADRRARLEVTERIDARGRVLKPLKAKDAERALKQLKKDGIEAVAVCFLHAYANPAHERAAGKAAERLGMPVSLSSEVSAEYGEYERFATAVMNSYVMPAVKRYLRELEAGVRALAIPAPVEVMQSNGGVIEADVAGRFPVRLASSGPAAGVIGASILAAEMGRSKLITLDMGGTSTDVSVVVDGHPAYSSEHDLDGYPVRAVGIDIRSIGAGGGSLARLDRTGSLRVGPESAGAEPGPACYGWGGKEPTVTDADLVLGYLDPERFCGGRVRLDAARARQVLHESIAARRQVAVEEAALGMLRVCITNMVGAVRNITTERGYDPRDFSLVAFGGAGPVHAAFVAAELNIPEVIVLRDPGLLSAKGLLLTNYRADVYRTHVHPLLEVDCAGLSRLVAELEHQAIRQLPPDRRAPGALRIRRILELCYEGQQNAVPIELDEVPVKPAALPVIAERLNTKFQSIFGFVPRGRRPQILHVRVFAESVVDIAGLVGRKLNGTGAKSEPVAREHRDVIFPIGSAERFRTPVFERDALPPGSALEGPLIVEERFSNTVVAPGQRLRVDGFGNLVIAVGGTART